MTDRHAEQERRNDETERACREPGGFGTVEISDRERRLLERVKLVAIPRSELDVLIDPDDLCWYMDPVTAARSMLTYQPPQDFDDG